jgi:hypothetical protein
MVGNARLVRYVSTQQFTNDLIRSPLPDETQAFQRRYREVDILLIDDIQVLENSDRAQDEFFPTFNALHNAIKQIVISSDRSPRQLFNLDDRLRTRFEWGLIADIQQPDPGSGSRSAGRIDDGIEPSRAVRGALISRRQARRLPSTRHGSCSRRAWPMSWVSAGGCGTAPADTRSTVRRSWRLGGCVREVRFVGFAAAVGGGSVARRRHPAARVRGVTESR